jgi:hypothetical protein
MIIVGIDHQVGPRRRLGRGAIGAMLGLLADNPWGRAAEMSIATTREGAARWEPIDLGRATDVASLRGTVELRSNGDDFTLPIEARMYSYAGLYTTIYVPGARFGDGLVGLSRARWVLATGLELMPAGSTASVTVDALADTIGTQRAFMNRIGMRRLPPPFTDVPWMVGLTRAAYTPYFTRDALLSAPAVSFDEDRHGTIWIQLYEQPLVYDTPGVHARLRAIAAHLEHHAYRPWQDSPRGAGSTDRAIVP